MARDEKWEQNLSDSLPSPRASGLKIHIPCCVQDQHYSYLITDRCGNFKITDILQTLPGSWLKYNHITLIVAAANQNK